jgi:hypothetical protein
MSPTVKVVNNSKPKISPEFAAAFADEIEDEIPAGYEEKKKVEVHSFVPDPSYAKRYKNRKVHGIADFDLMDYCMKNRKNLLMRGDTGAGKTMMPMAYAAKNGIPYYSIPCDVAIDTTSLFGKMMPTDVVGKFEWTDGPVTELVRHGGILNISEVNFMPPKISAALYQLLDGRRSLTLLQHKGEVIKAHPRLLIVADMNPKYRGTVELNVAFANRWNVKVDWGYDSQVESSLVSSPALLKIVQQIRKNDQVKTPVGTNAMEEFMQLAPDLGYDFAVQNFVGIFDTTERDAIFKVFQVNEMALKKDIATVKASKLPDDEMEEMDADEEWFEVEGDPNDFEPEYED